jgi:hypothetical protein
MMELLMEIDGSASNIWKWMELLMEVHGKTRSTAKVTETNADVFA